MFPLSNLIQHSHSEYMSYVWQKTNFLLRSSSQDQLRWFWEYIISHYDYKKFWKSLKIEEEQETFFQLLSHFCYLNKNHENLYSKNIERKSMWIFKHPRGGIYIPAEFVKILMSEPYLIKENFLFSLLFRLKFKEQVNLAALIKSAFDPLEIVTHEQNPRDMALVIYILFANFHTIGFYNRSVQKSQMVVNINTKIFDSHLYNPSLLKTPQPLWDYLYEECSHIRPAVDQWYYLIKHGKKGFYRSLSLISKPKRELVYLFSSGYLLPILPRNSYQTDKMQIVTPIEVIHSCNQQSVKNQFQAGV